MQSLAFFIAFATTAFNCFAQQVNPYGTADLAALNSLPLKWQQDWNRHDMDAMGSMLRSDVDFVNVAGVWMKGKQATVTDHKKKHQGIVFKNSVWTTDSVAIKYIHSDLAILHIGWGVKGDNDPDGTPRPPRHGIFTWLVSKQKGQWQLLAVHNVNIREPNSLAK